MGGKSSFGIPDKVKLVFSQDTFATLFSVVIFTGASGNSRTISLNFRAGNAIPPSLVTVAGITQSNPTSKSVAAHRNFLSFVSSKILARIGMVLFVLTALETVNIIFWNSFFSKTMFMDI